MDKPTSDAGTAFEAMLALDHALLRLPFEQLTKVCARFVTPALGPFCA